MRRLAGFAVCLSLGTVMLVVPTDDLVAQNTVHDLCSYCHSVHGSGGFVPLTDFNRDVDLCVSCHGDAGPAVYNGEVVPKDVDIHEGARHVAPDSTTCSECHDHEGEAGPNLGLIPTILDNEYTVQTGKSTVKFEARSGPNSFADGDATFDGICEVCHQTTTEHVNDGSTGQHNAATDCRNCHSHDEGWAAVSGCLRAGCHDQSQGSRRAVLATSDNEFLRPSHHADNLQDTDCVACHETRYHKGGKLRFSNVDNGSVVEVQNGVLSVADSAAKVTPICLACHDQSDGSPSSPPFANGQMPPPIGQVFWDSSSHAAANGTCTGCHATGHGSQKQWLLAPPTVAPTPPANAEEEEGFCYECHDANGPATTNIQAEFMRSTRHNVSADDPGGEFVECTNCHNPHIASAANKLADPVNPATQPWGGTLEGFCLECHDGTPPTGITFPPANWSGHDKSVFVGTAHDVMTGGSDSCRSCHEQHGSPFQSLIKAKYVMTDYNQWSQGDGDYQLCWNCHDENNIVRQNNAFEDLHDKHIRGEDAPCVMCHDVHGPRDVGESLIDFDYAVQNGYDIQYIDGRDASSAYWISGGNGFCYISCHGKDHKPKDYVRN